MLLFTGAFYAFTVNQLISTGSFQSGKVSYVLDSDDSGDHVDIDTPQDFVRAEVLKFSYEIFISIAI